MSALPIRIFKVAFGLGVVALFAWFCVFWSATLDRVDGTPTSALACDGPPVFLPTWPEETFVGPPVPPDRPPPDLASLAVERMFQARIYGPYASSVRDGLNEMVIGTSLLARGVLESDGEARRGLEQVLNAIPAQLPTFGFISSGYGTRRSPFTGRSVHHKGIDFAVSFGAPVYATADGVVTYAGWHRGLGRMVAINHGYGIVTKYGHNSGLKVRAGDGVRRGDVIAQAGSTGRSTGSHVHYEVWVNGRTIDPSEFMFDVPERPERPDLIAFGPALPSHHLGLAVGGDGAETWREGPVPYDREGLLPLNVAIVGLFGFVVAVLMFRLWPARSGLGRDVVN